jgi:hypothetical protein
LFWSNEANAPVEETLSDDWVVDQSTFNYTLPCDLAKTPAVAIVIHGKDRRDIIKGQEEGTFKYPKDISIAFDKFKTFCVAITVPKSMIGAFVSDEGEVSYFRDWQMSNSENDITLEEEIDATINLIHVANAAVKKPVYLVYGHDEGFLATKVMNALESGADISKTDPNYPIKGYVVVNTITGEFIVYNLDGTIFRSRDL